MTIDVATCHAVILCDLSARRIPNSCFSSSVPIKGVLITSALSCPAFPDWRTPFTISTVTNGGPAGILRRHRSRWTTPGSSPLDDAWFFAWWCTALLSCDETWYAADPCWSTVVDTWTTLCSTAIRATPWCLSFLLASMCFAVVLPQRLSSTHPC